MLVYVRESAIPEINVDASADDISEQLRRTLEKEQEEKARKKKERLEAHLYTVARIATVADLTAQIGSERFFDLVDHERVQSVCIKKELTLFALKVGYIYICIYIYTYIYKYVYVCVCVYCYISF